MRALALLTLCLSILGCGGGRSPARTPSSPYGWAPFGPGFEAAGAGSYTTRPTSGAVRGGSDAERIDQALKEVARGHGMDLAGDGRLADLGIFIGMAVDPNGSPPSSS